MRSHLFDRLVFTAPNLRGGTFILAEDRCLSCDSRPATGLAIQGDRIALGLQGGALLWVDGRGDAWTRPIDDIHDVLLDGDRVHVAETATNSLVTLDLSGREIARASLGSARDACHLNSIATWREALVASVFAESSEENGYKARTSRGGSVIDVRSGRKLITGLSQPHSLLPDGDGLLVANSGTGEVLEFSHDGSPVRSYRVGGYPRGLLARDGVLFVGISLDRGNPSRHASMTARIVAIDRATGRDIDSIDVPCTEVYDISSLAPGPRSELVLTDLIESLATIPAPYLPGCAPDGTPREPILVRQPSRSGAEAMAWFRNAWAGRSEELLRTREELESARLAAEEALRRIEALASESARRGEQLSEARFEVDLLLDLLIETESGRARLEADLTTQQGGLDALAAEKLDAERRLSEALQSLSARMTSESAHRERLDAILASTSWRVTRPIRSVKDLLLRLRNRRPPETPGLRAATPRIVTASSGASLAKADGCRVPAEPLVSFVMPVHDRTDLLREAIRSVLDQSVRELELIIVCDGSPPETLNVIEEFTGDARVRVFRYPSASGTAVRGRNKGILEARGRYIAFIDSDDVATQDRLALSLPPLEAGEADVIYGAWRARIDGSRRVDDLVDGQVVHSPPCDAELLRSTCVPCQSTVTARRSSLLEAGLLKPSMRYREDHELWARLAHFGARFRPVSGVLAELRLHAGNNELNFKHDDERWRRRLEEEFRRPGPIPSRIGFVIAGVGISGGLAVVLRHAEALAVEGHDVFLVNVGEPGDIDWYGTPRIPIVRADDLGSSGERMPDAIIATFWTTVEAAESIPARRKFYLVQSDERLFYTDEATRRAVASTYRRDLHYLGISEWICRMLREEFGHERVTLVPNGIDLREFGRRAGDGAPSRGDRTFRVLIEGPLTVPFKGVREACEACRGTGCEVWLVSSDGTPGPELDVDRFLPAVPRGEMAELYRCCDVFLKLSRVESFSLPVLEAMACGCVPVVGEVAGGIEYAIDGVNCLRVGMGDVDAARAAITRLRDEPELLRRLRDSGLETARTRGWDEAERVMRGLMSAEPVSGGLATAPEAAAKPGTGLGMRAPAAAEQAERESRIAAAVAGMRPEPITSRHHLELLSPLSRKEREEVARRSGTVVLYLGDEVKECRAAEEAAALAAAPLGHKFGEINGIDVGCGDRSVHPSILPVDISRKPLGSPGTHHSHLGNALLALPDRLPFAPASLDVIISLHTLEHLEDPEQTVLHWLELLKPGGGIGLVLPDWRYTWDSRRDRTPFGHKWNPEPDLLRSMHERSWSRLCTLERLATLEFRLSFDVVLRKHGIFQPFRPPAATTLRSGHDLHLSRRSAAGSPSTA